MSQCNNKWSIDSPHLLHMQHNFAIGTPLFIRLSQVDIFAEVEVHIKNNPHTIYHANTSFSVVSFVKFHKLHKHIPTLLYLFISCNHGQFISSFTSYPILLHFIEITCLHKWVSLAPIRQSQVPNKVWLTVPNSQIPNPPLQKREITWCSNLQDGIHHNLHSI